jgi:hypothetical protein
MEKTLGYNTSFRAYLGHKISFQKKLERVR